METIKQTKQLAFLSDNAWNIDLPISGFSVDARTIKPGQVFCALKGANADGHQFVEEAFSKGASCALIERECIIKASGTLLPVKNVIETLQKAASKLIELRKAKIIAITGSVGKTSTKEFLHTLLEKKFFAGKSIGNQNSQVGLPLSILNDTNGKEEVLVLEMGMTHPGNISQLIQIAPPDIALITQIALVHAANFPSIDAILQAKREIYNHPKTKIKICPYEWGPHEINFSLVHKNANFFLDGTALYENGEKIGNLEMPISGKHYHHNILGAIVAARYLGMAISEIQERLPFLKLYKQRFEFKEKQGILFIDDSYNASAISVKAALNNLPKPKMNRFTFAVIGSMLELGKFSDQCHIEVAEEALKKVDYLFCYGVECLPMIEVWKRHNRQAFYFESHAALVQELKCHVAEGDVVLIKGSRGKQMWKVLDEF